MTEEETATAEEPILEEGSGREQVRKEMCLITFSLCASPRVRACLCADRQESR